MADLDVSPVVQNGGGGSVQTGGVRAPDYRQVQAPAEVDTNLPNNEGARRAQALREAFSDFGGLGANVYKNVTSQAGALAGAASGATGHPGYKEGLARLTAYGRAFNNAATGAYAVEAEAQADDDAARLRVQANNDPAAFARNFAARRDGVLKEAPALAKPILTELYNRKLAEGIAAISGDQAAEQRQTQRQVWDIGVQRQTSRVAILQGSANAQDQLQAADEQVKLNLLIQGGMKSGLYSAAEAQAMHVNAMREITSQVFETQFDRELADPNGDPIQLLERFRNAHLANLANKNEPAVLSEPEFDKLMSDAKIKLVQQRQIDYYGKSQGKTAEELKHEAGDKQYTSLLFEGKLTTGQLDDAVRSGDLKPETARTLQSALEQGPGGKGNPDLYFKLHNDPTVLDMKPADIARYVGPGGLNGKQADALAQDIQRRNNGWESTAAVKAAKLAIDAALKIPPGTSSLLLSDEERKARTNALLEFSTQMNALHPSERDASAGTVAQNVIKKIQQNEAAAQVQRLLQYRDSAIRDHGPGSADQWSPDALQKYLDQKDKAIAAAKSAAGLP